MRLFVDNLTNVDFSYLDAKRGLVGETWLASIELEGSLDAQGMVVDFGIVKKKLRHWLDDILDHRLLVPARSSCLQQKQTAANDSISFEWHLGEQQIVCKSPQQALTFIDAEEINMESVAAWSQQQLAGVFPDTVQNLTLRFSNESIDTPFYHYSHGLKKHKGNCQRIAHGHRSRLNIWLNDQYSDEEVAWWAQNWRDIYIATEEDQCESPNTQNHAFAYEADQGKFYLEVPKNLCYLIDTDSTVELIAHHIAKQLKHKYPDTQVRVQAFEGMGKGAIVEL
ncbi:hypothetical protein TDB9533_02359 [Thalassocella blandensis]|nr:hypothetical protein TDB9533_02359 [Thalassocella blandensis]